MAQEILPPNKVTEIIEDSTNDSAIKDFEVVRANIHVVVDTIRQAMDELADISAQSQHPRSYEVLGKLADSAIAANKSLLDIQEKIKSIKKTNESVTERAKNITNNNLFVGSTAELQKLLKDMKEDNE